MSKMLAVVGDEWDGMPDRSGSDPEVIRGDNNPVRQGCTDAGICAAKLLIVWNHDYSLPLLLQMRERFPDHFFFSAP